MQPSLTGTVARRGWWLPAALLAALAVCAYGFWSRPLFRQEIWQPPGGERFLVFLGVAVVWFAAWIVWRPQWVAVAALCAVLFYSAAMVGIAAVAAVLLLLFACFTLGRILLDALSLDRPPFLALLTGLAAYLWIASLIAHAPVNYPLVWFLLLAAPLALRPRFALDAAREAPALVWPAARPSRFDSAALALALVPLLAQWLVALKPEAGSDALSMHLVVPAYMAGHHLWSFDFRHYAWAVMPMGGVWGYAIAYLLGGEFAARLLNFALLAALCGFLYRAARRWTTRPMSLLLVALFAANPVVQVVTGSLFVETFYAVLAAGALEALWRHRQSGQPAWLAVCAFLLGSAMAVKLVALPFVAAIGAVALWEAARAWPASKRWGPAAAAVFLATALVPYVYAWRAAGNPVFPFENQIFRAPAFAPIASPDSRFSEPLTWRTPFDVTFETHRYWEGQDGSLGFAFLLLAPLLLPWDWRAWKFTEWSLLAAAAGGALLGLVLRPNLRYLYPALPLLTLAFAPALRPGAAPRWLTGVVAILALVALGLNLWFLPAGSWLHKTFCLDPFDPGAADQYLASAAPVRLLVARLNREHPGENALFLETGDIAQFRALPYTNGWHDYLFNQRVAALRTPDDALALAGELGIRQFLYPDPARGVPVRESLWKDVIDRCSAPETEIGGFRVAGLRACVPPPAGPLAPGAYDDLDPRISYLALWSHDTRFPETAHSSVTYSDAAGASFRVAFHGSSIAWVYTRAANRGIAEVLLDGQPQGAIDLYSAETAWQSRSVFRAAAPGDHTFEVRLLARPNPHSAGNFVDVDELVVE